MFFFRDKFYKHILFSILKSSFSEIKIKMVNDKENSMILGTYSQIHSLEYYLVSLKLNALDKQNREMAFYFVV